MTEFLVILVIFLIIAVVVLGLMIAKRSSVATWHSPAGLPVSVVHGRAGLARPGTAADACCLDVPCGAECARRQQTIHSANYAEGLRDCLAYPNRVKELIRQGKELDERPDR